MVNALTCHLQELDDIHVRFENSIFNLTYMIEAMSSRDLDGTIESGLRCAVDYLQIQNERMCREIDDLYQLSGNSNKTPYNAPSP